MVLEQLDALRGEFAECDFLALADISSGTVLCVSAGEKIPQEQLDAYCAAAARFLNGDIAKVTSVAIGQAKDTSLGMAALLSGRQTVFFLRLAPDANEAVLCRCDRALDVGRFLQSMHSGLAQIAATP